MNELIYEPAPRKAPLHCRPGDEMFVQSIDHQYYRIIKPGWVTAGDSVGLVRRPNPTWSVTRFSQMLGAQDPTRKELAELTTLKGLASDWQWAAGKALKGVEQSLALFWGR